MIKTYCRVNDFTERYIPEISLVSLLTPTNLSIKHSGPEWDKREQSKQTGAQRLQPAYSKSSTRTLYIYGLRARSCLFPHLSPTVPTEMLCGLFAG